MELFSSSPDACAGRSARCFVGPAPLAAGGCVAADGAYVAPQLACGVPCLRFGIVSPIVGRGAVGEIAMGFSEHSLYLLVLVLEESMLVLLLLWWGGRSKIEARRSYERRHAIAHPTVWQRRKSVWPGDLHARWTTHRKGPRVGTAPGVLGHPHVQGYALAHDRRVMEWTAAARYVATVRVHG